MQPREKILAGALAAVAAVWLLGPMFNAIFIDPLDSRNDRIRLLEGEVADLEVREFELLHATRQLAEWRDASLPPDSYDAEREYPKWLYAMAELAGWEDVDIDPGPGGRGSRNSAFTGVSATISAEATLDAINHFLALMETSDLLQRIARLEVESAAAEGNPVMTVSVTLEGLAVADAAVRTRLFPTTELTERVSDADDTVVVGSAVDFPEEIPFRIRVNDELMDVVEMEGNDWMVIRGAAGTFPSSHDPADPVELLPLRESPALESGELALVVDRIFVKPRPGSSGRVRFADLPPAIRGQSFSSRLEVENWDPGNGAPRYRIISGAPDGLDLHAPSGQLNWDLESDAELTTYRMEVAAYGATADEPVLQETLVLEVRRPNRPPHLTAPEEIDVWLGRPLTIVPEVEDADLPDDQLTFSLGGNVPRGIDVNSRTGEIRWTPPVTENLGELELELTVTDSGTPPASDSVQLVLNLRDDSLNYTRLVGTIVQGDDHHALLFDRSTRDRIRLTEGASFQVADIQGTVEAIRLASIDIRCEGALYELPVGKDLSEWRLIEPADSDETPATGETSDDDDSE